MSSKPYLRIVAHYERCLDRFGDSHLGVDWPRLEDCDKRYQVMLDVVPDDLQCEVTMLDFGCGASHLYEYMLRRGICHVVYSGLDISHKFIALSKDKFPDLTYYCLDVLNEADYEGLPEFDYIVLNGVFTEKCDLSYDEMLRYFKRVLKRVFLKARRGIAFNVVSSHVDWEREDIFHLPLDTLAAFLTKELTRDFIIRNDYGLYEYTTYVHKTLIP